MSGLLSSIRPDSWNVPLLLHVLGAMVLVGAAGLGATASLLSVRSPEDALLRRLALRSFLVVAVPAYVVMRIGAEWLREKELGDSPDEPSWIGIGYATADGGALLLIATVVLSAFAVRRGSPRLARIAGVLSAIAVVAWLVAVWAMSAKP